MLVTLKEVLQNAKLGNYAVGAFNSPTLESARAAVEAAEELNIPIVLSHAQVHEDIIPLTIIGPILIQLAKEATVPVVVHLDHGTSFEYIKRAIDLGFTSVMIDASHCSFEENVTIVKKVVEYAHARNVSVEAELGTIVSSEFSAEKAENEAMELYTDPIAAKAFVEATNIDALAASFGTVHGLYLTEPQLDFKRLEDISRQTNIPIVMHGGSGLSEAEYKQTIQLGVCKINYYSYAAQAAANAIVDKVKKSDAMFFYHEFTVIAKEALKQNMMMAMAIFKNKAE